MVEFIHVYDDTLILVYEVQYGGPRPGCTIKVLEFSEEFAFLRHHFLLFSIDQIIGFGQVPLES